MKKKYLHLIALGSIYLLGYILCRMYFAQGMPMASYTADWLFRRSFMLTWVLASILIFVNKPFTATLTTIGCFGGMIVGEALGGWIRTVRITQFEALMKSGITVSGFEKAQAYHHYGILPIWFIVIILFVYAGIVIDNKKREC